MLGKQFRKWERDTFISITLTEKVPKNLSQHPLDTNQSESLGCGLNK